MGTEKADPDVEFRGEKQAVSGFHLSKLQVILIILLSIGVVVFTGIFAGVILPSINAAHSTSTQAPTTQPPAGTNNPTSTSNQGGSTSTPQSATSKPYAIPSPQPTQPTPTSSYAAVNKPRLPTDIVPVQYWFTLEIDMTNLNFSGDTTIEVTVKKETNTIILHASGLTMTQDPQVTNNRNYDGSTTYYTISTKGTYAPNQYYYMMMQNNLTPGTYYLRFRHTAPLSTRLDGLYKYQYTRASTGEKIWGVGSQCESFDARRIIPCFDEPALKARFQTTLIVPSNYTSSLTNMLLVGEQPLQGNRVQLSHENTVVMSSYLLAFSITDFDRVERDVGGILYRIWARKAIKNDGNYALEAAINITTYFENLLGVKYPLRKQDHVSVPKFDSGAMENWGLILYREEYLSYSPSYTDAREKEFIVAIIAHELAHMWFGNWVTMVWWNDLWLNEAFASYFEYIGQTNFAPETLGWDSFVGYDMNSALVNDQTPTSHPISPPEQYGPFFDRITYQKGATVLRMIDNYLGRQPFLDGLRNYLVNFNYSNAIASNLFDRMTERYNGINVTELMGPWVYQMGYPIVTVTQDSANNRGMLSQQRYLTNKDLNPSVDPSTQPYRSPYGYKWNIPITWFVGSAPSTINRGMFNRTSQSMTVSWPQNTWIKINAGSMGFYRVNYPQSNWDQLAAALNANPNQFTKRDAAGLILDSMAFASTGRLTYSTALSITNYLAKESAYVPWYVTWAAFLDYQRRLAARPSNQYFRNYYVKILKPQVDAIGFVGTGTHTERLLREIIMDAACYQGYEPCVQNATAMLRNYMSNSTTNAVPTDLKEVVYRYGIMYGGSAEWDFLWSQYHSSITIPDRDKIFYALSFSRNPASIRKFLSYAMDPTKIDRADTYLVMLYLTRNPVARPFVWDFFVENKAWFKNRYNNLRYPAYYASLYFDDDHNYARVEKFFADNPENTYYTTRVERNTLNRIKANKNWLTNHEMRFTKACRDNSM
ncbi:uncharacterized protein TRIADDRAFT_63531 [Trichoplax adhaerens]|uniref:Aminopeptidase n=1 Tax=Trichoplax adhaerens TaxID=10228 RepID=B3RHX6_TRIAD|nr:hypothetical protein TRIADDRAFT_63531 [Trichoplax adhaerens]EDV28936.1 hypothetical protein TRIADDRAFT_63531 [Trichoplax adhaerens]|eukprot:XP_002108138.1 hypothetical protein TRIADDRAFT_63531 [Trichoplax adhaerens]